MARQKLEQSNSRGRSRSRVRIRTRSRVRIRTQSRVRIRTWIRDRSLMKMVPGKKNEGGGGQDY